MAKAKNVKVEKKVELQSARHSELLFIWDAKMCNPNGDMEMDNAPRYDEADKKAVVSDVRIKRTIRDDLQNRCQEPIFVNNGETVQSAEVRFDDIKKNFVNCTEKEVFLSCLDNRLFGGIAPKSQIQVIGPVQFSWSKSLNRTETVSSQGTGAFGKDGNKNYTFRVDNYIPYGLFATYATINEMNAKKSGTTEDDVKKMINSLWNGTKNLNTRSKTGQKPRILIRVFQKDYHFIGLMDELVELKGNDSDSIRSFNEVELDFSALNKALLSKMVESVEVYYDISAEKIAKSIKCGSKVKHIEM